MGGKGSGRTPSIETIIRRQQTQKVTPIGSFGEEGLIIPNLSGDHSFGKVSKTPVNAKDIANKEYVDSATASLTKFDLLGTNNQVNLSASGADVLLTRDITISLPQDIHTSATPQFSKLGLGAAATNARIYMKSDGSNHIFEAAASDGTIIQQINYGGGNVIGKVSADVDSNAWQRIITIGSGEAGMAIRGVAGQSGDFFQVNSSSASANEGDILRITANNQLILKGKTGDFSSWIVTKPDADTTISGTFAAFQLVNSDTTNNNYSRFDFTDTINADAGAIIATKFTAHTPAISGQLEFYTTNAGVGSRKMSISPSGTYTLDSLSSNGFVKTSGGTGTLSVDTTTYVSAPSGSDTQIQYNSSGAFGASGNLYFDRTNNILVVGSTAGVNPNFSFIDADSTTPDYSGVGLSPSLIAKTIGRFGVISSTGGGFAVQGFSSANATGGVRFEGYLTSGTTSTQGAINFTAYKHNGTTGRTAITGTTIAHAFTNSDTNQLVILGNNMAGFNGTPVGLSGHHNLFMFASGADADASIIASNSTNAQFLQLYAGRTNNALPTIMFSSSATALRFAKASDSSFTSFTELLRLDVSGHLTHIEGGNIIFGTTTGTKIGTGTNQKIGFYNATPIVQGASIADASGGIVVDAEARTAINALISRIEALGLIATV